MRRLAYQDVAKRSDPMKKVKYTPLKSDRAVQLELNPTIATLSSGESRRFLIAS